MPAGPLAMWRRGELGRRVLVIGLEVTPRLGELLLSGILRSGSWTETRVGDVGKASSTGFRGARTRAGEPDGLCGRARASGE